MPKLLIKKPNNSLEAFIANASRYFPGKQNELTAVLCCAIASQHALFIGAPGTSKTALLKSLLFENAFYCVLNAESTIDRVVGPPLHRKYTEEGVFWHNTEDYLPGKKYGILDEFLDAPQDVLRGLHAILEPNPEDRVFVSGPQRVQCATESVFAVTNFSPDQREYKNKLAAVIDRFAVVLEVPELSDINAEAEIYGTSSLPRLGTPDLTAMQEAYRTFELPLADRLAIANARREMKRKGITVSIRKAHAGVRFLRAYCILKSKPKLDGSDTMWIASALITNPRDFAVAEKAVMHYFGIGV